MTSVIKWMFLLVWAAVSVVTVIHTMELEGIPEVGNLTDITSATGGIMAPYNSSIMAAKPWETSHRLSPYVRPQQYLINLYPKIENGSFVGSVEITIILDTAQSYIKLHANRMNITETKLNSASVTAFSYPEYDFWVVVPNETLSAGEYKLHISFEGSLLNKYFGFYRSYTDAKSLEPHYMAVSKFEPTFARSAFPCFDEPQLKSRFKISLTRPSGDKYIALSNMNQESEELNVPANGLTTVHFANSVSMSTYLPCFIVCDFQSLEPVKADHGFPLTVYARPGQTENMRYAQNVGLKAINYFVNYFGIQYPLPKIDLIAIPEYYSGATEHWGLVTFREEAVLYTEGISSSNEQEAVALIVSHEMAHMWFGNLVTMKWWNDIWLNEGFATYMKYKAYKVVCPDCDVDLIQINRIRVVQSLDSELSSHAIIQDVSYPQQIRNMFYPITYGKGSAVVRMLEGMLGEEVFRIGVSAYLKRFEYSNAGTDDLWAELQISAQNTVDVKKVMDTWTRQAGFPVVSAVRNGTKLTLKQQRFFFGPSSPNSSAYNYKWEIPITYTTSKNNTVHNFLLTKDKDLTTIDIPDAEWIKLNHRQVGYYMTNYSENDWYLLSRLLENNSNALSAADRTNLIYDAFSLAEADYLPYSIALNMAKYLSLERHFDPWNVAVNNFFKLRNSLYQRPAQIHFDRYVQHILGSIKEDFWNDSKYSFRTELHYLGCLCGLPSCRTKFYKLFKQFLDDKVQPNQDIRDLVYNYGMSQGNVSEWNKMWDLYLNEQEDREKTNIRIALTASKEVSILTRLLQYAKNETLVNSQDYFPVIKSISRNPVGTQLVWDFLRNEWQYLVDRFSLNHTEFGDIIPSVSSQFNTQERLEEMKVFFDKYPESGAGKDGRKTAIDAVSNNIKWLESHEADISNWLTNNSF